MSFDIKKKGTSANFTAKLTFLWYDNFGTNPKSLQRNGKAAIPKITVRLGSFSGGRNKQK